MRQELLALSPANVEYFNVIDSALFVLSLDDGCPETPEQRVRQGYIGDAWNRWFDKSLQFFVSANGRSGLITEHGGVDGTSPARLSEWVAKAIDEYHSVAEGHNQKDSTALRPVDLKEVILQTTAEIQSHMDVLSRRFLEYTSAGNYLREQLTEFGTEFLVEAKMPVKQVVDITFQLAVRLLCGRNLPAWESVSVAHFHQGRTEAVQRAPPAVVAFCNAAAEAYRDGGGDKTTFGAPRLMALLSVATKQMHADVQATLNGRSHVRFMELLRWLWPSHAEIPKPRFLSENLFFGKPFVNVQSNALETDSVVEDLVSFLYNNPEGFWSIMMPEKGS